MELRQLTYFTTVATELNISRAAQKLHLTQPALSRQIKALEDELDVLLLERGAHSIKLTEEGKLFLKEATEVLERADLAVKRVRRAGSSITLHVGYSPSLAAGLLGTALGNFTQVHPKIRVNLLDLSSQEMTDGLLSKKLDLVVTAMPDPAPKETQWIPISDQGWCVAVGRNHPLAAAEIEQITPKMLNGQKLLLFTQQDYPEYWQFLLTWFRKHKIDVKVAGEYDGVSSLMAAAQAGLGIALVSEGTAMIAGGGVVLKPVNGGLKRVPIAAGLQESRVDDKVLGVLLTELKIAGTECTRVLSQSPR